MKGYVMLPIFTVELRDGEFVMTCNDFLAWIFEFLFAPFWDGKVHVWREDEESEREDHTGVDA